MTPSSKKAKGRSLQQYCCRRIRETFDLPEDDVVSRSSGSGGEDVMQSDRARELLPLSWECKNTKKFPSIEAIRQARANSKGYTPVVAWKPPGKSYDETIVYFNINDFLELWKNLKEKN